MNKKYDIAIVGTGIVGLAIAYHAGKAGKQVVMFERNPKAVGASIRNFGMVWPIGQPLDKIDRALEARSIWLDLAEKADFWAPKAGSIHLAYEQDELDVLEEFVETRNSQGYEVEMLTPKEVTKKSDAINPDGLLGGMWSATEVNIDPRQAIEKVHQYLQEAFDVSINYGTVITTIEGKTLSSHKEQWSAEQIFVCSGTDFETLYPEIFKASNITKCKLQMMRTTSQPNNWQLGPNLAAGLTLQHYDSFAHCNNLPALKQRLADTMAEYNKWGIHVLVSQTALGEITIGDSHEYDWDVSPFNKSFIDDLILDYLKKFARFPDATIAERWYGVYPKLPGQTELIAHPADNIVVVNGVGGTGMTLSFGLAKEVLEGNFEVLNRV